MTTLTIPTPDVSEDRASASAIVAEARAIAVTDQSSFDAAGAFLRRVVATKKALEAKLKPAVDAAHAAHKSLTALRAELVAPFDAARAAVEPKVVAWQDAERRRLAEQAAAAARAARAAAEAEIIAAAEKAEAEGQTEAAAAILEETPLVIAAPAPVAPKTEGVSFRETWKAEVYDFAALVAAGDPAYLLPNQSALDGIARALKGAAKIPGVRFVAVRSTSIR
jgi:hypothetical protein